MRHKFLLPISPIIRWLKNRRKIVPQKLPSPCRHQGCPEITTEGYCQKHKREDVKEYDKRRGSRIERGYTKEWLRVRIMKLARDPLCERCLIKGIDKQADIVHHRDRNPRNNMSYNLESLCFRCHDNEHAKEKGTGGRSNL